MRRNQSNSAIVLQQYSAVGESTQLAGTPLIA